MNKLFNTHILSFFAAMLLIFNIATIALADEKTPKESKPEAIIAAATAGLSWGSVGSGILMGLKAGLSIDAEELAPTFALAAAGASFGEIVSSIMLLVGAGLAIGSVLALAG